MKVRVTFDFDERDRLAIAYRYGGTEPASRDTCRSLIEGLIETTMDDLRNELDQSAASPVSEQYPER